MALLKDGTRVYGTLFANAGFNSGTINATSNGIVANSTNISLGNSSVNVAITSSTIDLGTQFDANSTGLYHTGTINAASFTTSGLRANTSGIFPTSNTILLGNSIGRFVLSANTGSFSGAVSGITTLATGNTTITGFANASVSVNSALLTVGTSFIANTTGAYHTGLVNAASHTVGSNFIANSTAIVGTGFANVTTSVNSALLTVGTSFIANSTAIVGTGYANVTTSVNSALLTVGTAFIANTTGAYHTGLVNAASHTVGSNFIANSTAIVGTGFANVTTSVNSALLTVGTDFIANTTGAYHTGLVNSASFTTTGFVANTTSIAPTSNTILLGNTIGRFVVSANTIDASGLITGSAGANITGTANLVDVNISGNLTVSGTTTYINTTTLNVGDNIVSLNADLSAITAPTENAGLEVNRGSSANVSFLWNETSDSWTSGNSDITGYANATVSVNSALLTVGSSFIANTTGAYHSSLVNSASFTTTGFVANTTSIAPTSNTILLGNTIGRFVVSANTIDASGLITGSAGATITGQVNASTGFGVGTINATSNGFFANATSISVGNSTVNVSITPTNIDLGTQFDANSTGLYHTGTVNAATLSVGSSFVANSTTINFSTINATSNGITANTTAIAFGNSSVNISINTSSVNVATYLSGSINATSNGLLANSTTVTVGNSSVNVSITTAGITSSGGTGVNPSSNTVGTALGTNTQRWVLNANTGSFAGLVSGITTLAAGNTTITGFANVTTSIQGGSSLTIAGAASGITTLAAGNTTITGFANVTTSIQGGSSLTIAGAASGITTLAAGNTTITGFANASVSVNSALLTVGTSFVANTTGAYHTGIVNAASHTVGTSFVANTTQVTLTGIPLSANGTTGTSAQVLSSNGTVGSPYWATISSGSTVTATDDTTTAASRYLLFANQTSGTVTAAYVSSTKLTYNPSTGALTSTSHVSSSDERFKTNVVTINSPLDMIKQLRGVSFDRIDSGLKDYGVIAQEIEQVIPDIVHTDDEGYKSVSYSSIIGFLIEGMKHQQVKIDNLENKIEDLLKK